MNDKAPATGMRAELARHLILDHNPLRRRTDRVQTAIMAVLLAAFLAGAPLVVIAAGSWAHAGGLRERRAEWSWHQVPAVLLQSAPRQTAFRRAPGPATWVRAQWTPPGGPARAGVVAVPPGSLAGSRALVWVGRSGPVAGVPLAQDQITARVVAAGILALALLAAVILGLAWGARRLLVRRRLAAWEADWTSVGPQWTRRGQ